MRPDWKLVLPSDPQYDAGHPIKYAADAYGVSDLRAAPDGELPRTTPDDHDFPYGWTVAVVPNQRATAPFGSRFIATKT